MAAPVVQDVVNAAITELSQVPGLNVNIYAVPRLQQFVQNAVLLEIQEMWWPMLMHYQTVAIDPTTGIPTTDLSGPVSTIDDFGDIAAIYRDMRNDKIPELPQSVNPFAIINSSRPRYVSADSTTAHRPFRIWPAMAANVVVWGRQTPPQPMALTDKVYIDHLMLLYDACWMYAVDDGTVPAQVNKYQVLAANRRKKMIGQYSQAPLALDTRRMWDSMIDTGFGDGSDFFVLDQDPLA